MAIGTATALAGAGALASAFGGSKKQVASENLSGYQALPKEVQDLLIEQYLPKAQATLNMPYQNIPMQRAQNPAGDPFASQGLYDLQKFSDAAGGYFTPYNQGADGQVSMGAYQGAAGNRAAQPMQSPDSMAAAQQADEMLVNQYLNGLRQGQGGGKGWAGVAPSLEARMKGGQFKASDFAKTLKNAGYTGAQLSDPNLAMNLLRGGV